MRPGIELRRERRIKGKVEVEVSYAITSLTPDGAGAERLLVFVRDHGTIENQLHDVRDVTLGEDAGRVRTGSVVGTATRTARDARDGAASAISCRWTLRLATGSKVAARRWC